MKSTKILFVLALLFCCQVACQDDTKRPEFDQDLLTGRWEIEKGWRNGKQTETLTDTYFEFDETGNLRTNLTPALVEDEFSYSFSRNEIRQKSEPEIVYTIENLTDSLLLFSMSMNNIPFRLQLKKVFPPDDADSVPGDTL